LLVRGETITLHQLSLKCDGPRCEARYIPNFPVEDEERLRKMASARRWQFWPGKDYCSVACAKLDGR